jgi:hypothetical protein
MIAESPSLIGSEIRIRRDAIRPFCASAVPVVLSGVVDVVAVTSLGESI